MNAGTHRADRLAVAVRLLHYGCPVALGGSIPIVVRRATGRSLYLPGLGFLLLGIAAAYALDRLLDTPEACPGGPIRPLLAASLALAVAFGAGLALLLPARNLALVLLLGAGALSYRRWKRLPFAKALAVPLVWTWAGLVLPFRPESWFGWRALITPVALPLFLLLTAGCLLCDLKDQEQDRRVGVRSLPVMIGIRRTLILAVTLAAGAVLSAGACHRMGLAIGGLVLILLGGFAQLARRGPLGALAVDMALTLPGLLIAAHLV